MLPDLRGTGCELSRKVGADGVGVERHTGKADFDFSSGNPGGT
jgi:hypothetical protein